jgi:hypothetical protein
MCHVSTLFAFFLDGRNFDGLGELLSSEIWTCLPSPGICSKQGRAKLINRMNRSLLLARTNHPRRGIHAGLHLSRRPQPETSSERVVGWKVGLVIDANLIFGTSPKNSNNGFNKRILES